MKHGAVLLVQPAYYMVLAHSMRIVHAFPTICSVNGLDDIERVFQRGTVVSSCRNLQDGCISSLLFLL